MIQFENRTMAQTVKFLQKKWTFSEASNSCFRIDFTKPNKSRGCYLLRSLSLYKIIVFINTHKMRKQDKII